MESEEGIPLPKNDVSESAWSRFVKRRVPITCWGRRYDRLTALSDAVAGVTLGLTLVPQSIAYASLANLPVQYGLYSSFVGTMLYVVLGTVKEVSIGPTSLLALLTLHVSRDHPIEYVVLLAFLAGCLVLLMGLLRLGFLVDLISPSVTKGFTSAVAVIIVVAQIKGLLGLSFVAETIYENVSLILQKWAEVRIADCILSLVCIIVLLLLRKLNDLPISPKRTKLKKCLWLVSISRNAIVVFSAATFAYLTHGNKPLVKLLSRNIVAGLPRVSPPPFSVNIGNATVPFSEMVQDLSSSILVLPLVMVLANISVAKAFTSDKRVDASQEMITLGICNIVGSFVQAMPTCGAFTRSAVSHASGVRTPAAGLYSGVITLLALSFMTQYFYYIPKACLSSVLICAVIFMIDVKWIMSAWRSGSSGGREEAGIACITLAVSAAKSVELAVLVGALCSLAALLRRLLHAPLHTHTLKVYEGEAVRIRPTVGLVYLNAGRFGARLKAAAAAVSGPPDRTGHHSGRRTGCRMPPLLIDCSALALVDYTATLEIERLIKEFKKNDQKLLLYNASPEAVRALSNVECVDKRVVRARSAAEALALSAAPAAGDAGEAVALLTCGNGQTEQPTV